MNVDNQVPMEAAIRWHIRLREGDDRTWEEFEEWLAADPNHPVLYDEVEQLDADLASLLPKLGGTAAANDADHGDFSVATIDRRQGRWRWFAAAGSIAAVAVAALLLPDQPSSKSLELVTAAGQRRFVRVGQDVTIALNGSTRLLIDGSNGRSAELLQGQAFFRVRHDGNRPFVLKVGDARILDLGTTFDVTRVARQVRVAVGEGEVLYRSDSDSTALGAGQALVDQGDGLTKVARAPEGSIGAWRDRQLVYTKAPLSQVAQDIGRILGVTIVVPADLRDRPFSGSIVLREKGVSELRRLAAVLDVVFVPATDGWTMKSVGSANR